MASTYRRSPLGIVKLTRSEFDRLARAGRIHICRSGTPYVDIAAPGDPPRWEVLEIEPECLCRQHGPLRDVHGLCPRHQP